MCTKVVRSYYIAFRTQFSAMKKVFDIRLLGVFTGDFGLVSPIVAHNSGVFNFQNILNSEQINDAEVTSNLRNSRRSSLSPRIHKMLFNFEKSGIVFT